MSYNKKLIRLKFKNMVFGRDKYVCRICNSIKNLDAHHITDRNLMPNGGYVIENGITLCEDCHIKAEQFHITGVSINNFSPNDLYIKIKSSYNLAVEKSNQTIDN